MATSAQRDDLRYDLDVDSDILGDEEADDVFDRSTARYSTNTLAVEYFARIIAIGRLLAGAARRSDYVQNQSAEKLSQIFNNLIKLREIYRAELTEAVAVGSDGEVMYGGLRRKPSRLVELPNDMPFPQQSSGVPISGFDNAEFE